MKDFVVNVACPRCGAPAGGRCRDVNTGLDAPGMLVHLARVSAWEQAGRPQEVVTVDEP